MVKASEIVAAARSYAGSPYRWWTGAFPEYGPPGYMDYQSPGYYSPGFVKREGVHCAGLINLARMECGLEPVGLTKAYYDWLYDSGEWFDPSTPGVPGAICVHPWQSGMGAGNEGHVAMYTDEHTLVQSVPGTGVYEGEQDYDSHAWADYWLYALMSDVDYSEYPGGDDVPLQTEWYLAVTREGWVQLNGGDWSGGWWDSAWVWHAA